MTPRSVTPPLLTCMLAPGPGDPMNIQDMDISDKTAGMKEGMDMCFFKASEIAG